MPAGLWPMCQYQRATLGFRFLHRQRQRCRCSAYSMDVPSHLINSIMPPVRIPDLWLASILILKDHCGRDAVVSGCYRRGNDRFLRGFAKDSTSVLISATDCSVLRGFIVKSLPDNSGPSGYKMARQRYWPMPKVFAMVQSH